MDGEKTAEEVAGEAAAAEAAAAEAAKEGGEKKDHPKSPTVAVPAWLNRRLGQEQGRAQRAETVAAEEKAKREAAENEIARLKAERKTVDGDAGATRTKADIDADIAKIREDAKAEAEKKAKADIEMARFNERCDAVYDDGKKLHKADWKATMDALADVIGGFPAAELDKGFMTAVLETDNPREVLYRLGKEPEEADRIINLSKTAMLKELIKLGMAKPKRESKAPDPPETLNGGNDTREGVFDELDSAEWHRRREARVAELKKTNPGRYRRL